MKRSTSLRTLLVAIALLLALPGLLLHAAGAQAPPAAQQGTTPASATPQASPKSELPAVRNFTRVDATIACGGAVSPSAVASIKDAGFKSIVNLRAATEEGADVEAEMKAAEAAGVKYIWLPFVTASPDATKVDDFLKAVADPANQPMLIHCASGGRASVFWAIKRVMVDGWPVDKAMTELPELHKNVSPALEKFALDYLKQHGK